MLKGRDTWELLWGHRMPAQNDYAKMNDFTD
jgi:hypothetical protein